MTRGWRRRSKGPPPTLHLHLLKNSASHTRSSILNAKWMIVYSLLLVLGPLCGGAGVPIETSWSEASDIIGLSADGARLRDFIITYVVLVLEVSCRASKGYLG